MKKLFVIALAAVGMVACVNDEIVETPQGNAISFDNAFIDNATRAELTAANLDAFKVWGYIDAENGQVAPLFEGDEVSKATGDWAYEGGARYWAPGMKHYFQAIAPQTTATSSTSVIAAEHADGKVSAINYTVDGDSDLIYAAYEKVGAAAGSTNGPVSFTFGHLLSKVEFEFVNGFAAEDGVTIAVKNVKMTVPAKGTYDIANEAWTVNTTVPAKTLENIEGSKFVLPYDNSYAYAIEFDVDVTYGGVLINEDVHKTSSVMVALNKGTAYKFTATINAETLNMESIDFEVGQVDGWIVGGESTLGTAYVSTVDALQAALNNPGVDTIVLAEDVTLTEGLTVNAVSRTRAAVEPVAVTLDLNGKTITGEVSFGNAVIKVEDGAALIVKNGTVKSVAVNGGSALLNKGLLTLCNDVTVVGAQNGNDGNYASYAVNTGGAGSKLVVNGANISGRGAIGATNGAQVELNGGIYHTPYAHWGHAVYANGAGVEVVINDGTFTEGYEYANNIWGQYQIYSGNGARVIVRGGDFSQTWDCANGYDLCTASDGVIEISGGIFADDPSNQNGNDYVADGYNVLQNAEGKYEIVAAPVVSTTDGLKEALASGPKDVLVAAGEYTFPASSIQAGTTIICEEGVVFEGQSSLNINGATVIGATFSNESGYAVRGDIYGNFKNCVFEASEALRWCYADAGKPVLFENCVIKTDFRGFHFDDIRGCTVTFKNCEINGFNAYGGEGTVVFENCSFGNDQSSYNGLNIYSNTVLTDCEFTFISGKTNFIDLEDIGRTLTITNCTATLDGVAADVKDFVGGSKKDQNTVIVDGKVLVEAANQTDLNDAVKEDNAVIELGAGNYDMPSVGNTVTISGDENTVITVYKPNCTGGDVTFDGVTVKGSGYSTGVQHVNTVTYNKATIVGDMCLYGEKVVFNECTFELAKGQYLWTYGAKEVEFIGCTFNTEGKAILIYNEGAGASNVTVTGCTFNATAPDKAGAIANQSCAAIEIDNFQDKAPGVAHKLTTSGNTYSSNFSGEWRIKNYVAGGAVNVNDVDYTQIAIDGHLMTKDSSNNVTVL